MKKLILLILAFTLLCSAARAETLVVWFSCTGKTEGHSDGLRASAGESAGSTLAWRRAVLCEYHTRRAERMVCIHWS